jgi:hypothetical protein
MTREDIIRMAREAELTGLVEAYTIGNFERFAALVAEAEREACKQIAKEHAAQYEEKGLYLTLLGREPAPIAASACNHIAHLIDQRGNK